MQTGLDASLLSWYNNGEPCRGQMQQRARGASILLRLCCRGNSRSRWKLLAPKSPPPFHLATCRHGKPLSGDFWTIPSLQWAIETLSLTRSGNEGKPYGAPSMLRRGKAGAPLLKGQKPDIALRSCGLAQMGQMTYVLEQPSVRRSLNVASLPLWSLRSSTKYRFLLFTFCHWFALKSICHAAFSIAQRNVILNVFIWYATCRYPSNLPHKPLKYAVVNIHAGKWQSKRFS